MKKIRIGYIGVHIATYYALEHRQLARAVEGLTVLGTELGFELVGRESGAMDVEAAEAAARDFADANLDFLLVQTAACCMADVLLPFADLGIPLGIWATPEPGFDGDIQLNSFVSGSIFASTLQRYYRPAKPFKWFYGHVEDPSFVRRFEVTVRALTGRAALSTSRVSWIGGLAPGFHDLLFDQRDLEARLGGARVVPRELRDLVDIAETFSQGEARRVQADMIAAARAVNVPDEFVERNARLYLALRHVCDEDGTNAVALQDWPVIQDVYEVSPLLALCWLAERDGVPAAHEGDVLGALTMRMLAAVAQKPATIMDIAAVEIDRGDALLWHCGGSPHSLANDAGVTYEYHSTLGRKQSRGPWGAVVDQVLAPGECTIAYLSNNVRSLWSFRAEVFADAKRSGFDGDRGWIRGFRHSGIDVPTIDLLETLMTTGQEHHHGLVYGDFTEELSELAAWMGFHEIAPVRYRDAMQRADGVASQLRKDGG